MLTLKVPTAKQGPGLPLLLAAVLVMTSLIATEPNACGQNLADDLLTDIEKDEAKAAAQTALTRWPKWDGKESVADYAKRAGLKDVQKALDLGAGVSMKFTLIPAGTFMMGARGPETAMVEGVKTVVREAEEGWQPGEGPQREVTISQPFYMGIHEVTQEQFRQTMGFTPVKNSPDRGYGNNLLEGDKKPVVSLPWENAAKFCKQLSAKTGKKVSLPTEAQWEYACRAGTTTRFHFGDDAADMCEYCNYCDKRYFPQRGWNDNDHDDGFEGPAPVGSFLPNNWGLHDMHGNTWEWCSDWYADHSVNSKALVDPTGPELPLKERPYHVCKGGFWGSDPNGCRSCARPTAHAPSSGAGFRVVMALE